MVVRVYLYVCVCGFVCVCVHIYVCVFGVCDGARFQVIFTGPFPTGPYLSGPCFDASTVVSEGV